MRVNFISSKDTGKTRTIFEWSHNEEMRSGNETYEVIEELFKSVLNNYQKEGIILIKKVILYSEVLIYCLIAFIKQV